MQATPVSKVTGKPAPGVGGTGGTADKPGATPDKEITLANPTPADDATGAAAAAGDGTTSGTETPASKGSRFPNLSRIATGVGQIARGVGGALGSVIKGADDAIKNSGSLASGSSLAQIQDTSGWQGNAAPGTTAVAAPGTTAVAAPVAAKPATAGGATPDLGAKPGATGDKPPVGVTPDLGAKPEQPQTQDSPIAKPGEEKPAAAAPVAAKGKTMSKQEILSWISRNDEDNAALQSFKDAIAAAEKTGASTAAAEKPATGDDYSKANPGIQNIQVPVDTVTTTPKPTSTATQNYGAPKVSVNQLQTASKQYKKAPL
jgi:hypothetical protein